MKDLVLEILKDEALWAGSFMMRPDLAEEADSGQPSPEKPGPESDFPEAIRSSGGVSRESPGGGSTSPHAGVLTLDDLRSEVERCERCRLHSTRKNVVFGQGNPDARVMFIGEAPDATGQFFVGKAGELLTNIIQGGMKLKREDIYIANIIKCRPPENREPGPDEVAACRGYLVSQIRMVSPDVIIALGSVASQSLLDTDTPISKLRGKFGRFEGIPVMPTFHPSYLVQNPLKKREVWEDIKQVLNFLGMRNTAS